MARWVDKPYRRPGRCALVAHRGQMTPGRWLDCGPVGAAPFEEHVYLHEQSLREMARDMLGWHSPAELKAAAAQAADLQAQLERMTAERDGLREKFDALDLLGLGARQEPPAVVASPQDAARREQINAKRLEALARGRATAAANRAARAKQEATT